MTKKHFVALASAFNGTKPPPSKGSERDEARHRQWEDDVKAVAFFCNLSNTSFDMRRFLSACKGV